MTLEQLHALVATLELGTFTRAAEELGISQSTLSFRIKSLEEGLGEKLLDRGGGEVRPTAAGERLLPLARQMLDLAAQAASRVHDDDEPSGEVTLATSTVPAEYLLPPLLARFRRRYPRVSIVLRVRDSREATRSLLDGACDLAIVGAESGDRRRLLSVPFATDEIVLVRAATFDCPDSLSPADLERIPWVRREVGSGTRQAVDSLLRDSGSTAHGSVETTSTEAVRRCVLAGLGLGFLSAAAAQEDLAAGRLIRVAFPGTPIRRRFFLQRLRTRTLPLAAESFWNVARTAPDEPLSTK